MRVKVTTLDLPAPFDVSFNTCPQVKATPELTVKFLNAQAKRRNVNATYELATEQEYQAYRADIRAELAIER